MEQVLAGSALRGAAGQHRGESPHDLAVLLLDLTPLLVAHMQLLEGAAGRLQPLLQLLARDVAPRGGVRDAS